MRPSQCTRGQNPPLRIYGRVNQRCKGTWKHLHLLQIHLHENLSSPASPPSKENRSYPCKSLLEISPKQPLSTRLASQQFRLYGKWVLKHQINFILLQIFIVISSIYLLKEGVKALHKSSSQTAQIEPKIKPSLPKLQHRHSHKIVYFLLVYLLPRAQISFKWKLRPGCLNDKKTQIKAVQEEG